MLGIVRSHNTYYWLLKVGVRALSQQNHGYRVRERKNVFLSTESWLPTACFYVSRAPQRGDPEWCITLIYVHDCSYTSVHKYIDRSATGSWMLPWRWGTWGQTWTPAMHLIGGACVRNRTQFLRIAPTITIQPPHLASLGTFLTARGWQNPWGAPERWCVVLFSSRWWCGETPWQACDNFDRFPQGRW